MKNSDLLHETYSALSANKARSGLTMLGIIIGIASVIAMTAIGQGAQNSVSASIQSIGANLVMIMPGAARTFGGPSGGRGGAQTLTVPDADAIASQVSNVVKTVEHRLQQAHANLLGFIITNVEYHLPHYLYRYVHEYDGYGAYYQTETKAEKETVGV